MATYKGRYKPANPDKYLGDPSNIVYRSSWELRYMKFLDHRRDILKWASEEIVIPYKNPVDGRIRRYFPDFYVKMKNKHGFIEEWIVEIKPEYQTKPPTVKTRKTRRYLEEVKTYAINKYKWDSAREWCENRGYKFVVLTEKHLNIK